MSIKLVIADDHEVVRRGLVSLLAGSEVKVVGEASGGEDAIKLTRKLKPDVLLLDIRMPGKDGLEVLEKVRADMPNVRVVMLSTFDNPTYVARAVAGGAHDYMLKGCTRAELIHSIAGAAAGQLPMKAGELRRVATTMANRVASPNPDIRGDGEGARAKYPAEDRRQRPYSGCRVGRPTWLGLTAGSLDPKWMPYERVKAATHRARGCALSKASRSLVVVTCV